MSDVVRFVNGHVFKQKELHHSGNVPVLRVGNLFSNEHIYYSDLKLPDCKYCKEGDLLFAWSGSFGPFLWKGKRSLFHYHIWRLELDDNIDKTFLYYWLLYESEYIKRTGHGLSIQHISKEKMEHRYVALPPLSEQQRIVACMEKLFPLIDRYGQYEQERCQLEKSFLQQLKTIIRRQTVQGRLVAQERTEEPALLLAKRIRSRMYQLLQERKIKKSEWRDSVIFKGEDGNIYERIQGKTECINHEIPFNIPDTWVWCRLSSVIVLVSGRDLPTHQYHSEEDGMPYLTGASCIVDDKIVCHRYTNEPTAISKTGDLLFVCKGTIGTMVINTIGDVHIARQIMAMRSRDLYMPYLKMFLSTYQPKLRSKAKSIIPGISRNDILSILFPLPPFSEQQRIVEYIRNLRM